MSYLTDYRESLQDEIRAEMARQDAKWGVQDHPDGTARPGDREMPARARDNCQLAAANGTVTWRHILSEEICEAYAERDGMRLREELIQVAAVACSWIEAIDRREGMR